MTYAWTPGRMLRLARATPFLTEFTGAEMLTVRFRTDPEVVRRVLPAPLRVPDRAFGTAFVASYPTTSFGATYREGALLVDAAYRGETGQYCLAMPVDDDMAMIGGRETFGYPKKIAEQISLTTDGDHVVGSVVRRGTEILRIEGELGDATGPVDAPARTTVDPVGRACRASTMWLFKYFPAVGGGLFEHAPLLVRQVVLFRPREPLRGATVDLKLVSSVTDPLGDIPVLEVTEATYGLWDNTMLPGRRVRRIRNTYRFAPKSFFKYDWFELIDAEASARPLRERRRLRRQLRRY